MVVQYSARSLARGRKCRRGRLTIVMRTLRTSARRYWAIWVAVAPLLAWAIIRSFGLDEGAYLTQSMALTPWVAIAGFLLAGLCVALRNWAAALVAGLAFAALAAAVLPRAVGGGEDAPPGAVTLKVLSANVYRGKADANALVDLVERIRPDLVALQELRPGFVRRLHDAGLGRLLPHAALVTRAYDIPEGRPGIGVYSRWPLRRVSRDPRSSELPLELSPPDGGRVRVVNFHPLIPSGDQASRWEGALEELPSAGTGLPTLLIGDFNATLDQSALRAVIDRGYRDAAEATGMGLEMTWPTDHTLPPLVAIDHVLADDRLGIADYGVEDLPGSDHRAIWASVFLPR
jgi:endonuclease/exonuclease/phosphatase family metal-dependent hydrolase